MPTRRELLKAGSVLAPAAVPANLAFARAVAESTREAHSTLPEGTQVGGLSAAAGERTDAGS